METAMFISKIIKIPLTNEEKNGIIILTDFKIQEKKAMRDVWGALTDKTRREILTLLKGRPHTAGEICDQFELTAATVSHHLSVLKDARLVKTRRRAQTIIYSLNTTVLQDMLVYLMGISRK